MLTKSLIQFLKWQDKKFTSLTMRAMKWTGRSERAIHPKHLYDDNRNAALHELFFDGMVFLDIGSGSGSDCLYALEKGARHAYGAEKDQHAIAISHDRMKGYAGKYTIFDCNLEDAKIDIPDNSVDVINFSNVLEHLHNRQGILAELQRVLKPDGKLYISIPNTNTPLHPVVPSLPIHGVFSLSAILSPGLYKKLQNWKIDYVKKKPEHSVGWHFLAQPKA